MPNIWSYERTTWACVGKGGVRLRMKNTFGKEYMPSQPSASMVMPQDLKAF